MANISLFMEQCPANVLTQSKILTEHDRDGRSTPADPSAGQQSPAQLPLLHPGVRAVREREFQL
jgi:hypothetical protein